MDFENLIRMNSFDFLKALNKAFEMPYIPTYVDSMDDLVEVGHSLGRLAMIYSSYTQISLLIGLYKRNAKDNYSRLKSQKEDYEMAKAVYDDFIDKEKIMEEKIKELDVRRQTLSRQVAIKQEINNELKMIGDIP